MNEPEHLIVKDRLREITWGYGELTGVISVYFDKRKCVLIECKGRKSKLFNDTIDAVIALEQYIKEATNE